MDLTSMTIEELKRRLEDLHKPGAWDYDPNLSYARAYMCMEIKKELEKRGVTENGPSKYR